MALHKDLKEFIASLNSHHVDYLIVGAFALAFHGVPRYTGDIDILVRATPENAAHVDQVLKEFSFVSLGLAVADFLQLEQVVQLGYPPNRLAHFNYRSSVRRRMGETCVGRASGDSGLFHWAGFAHPEQKGHRANAGQGRFGGARRSCCELN